MEFVNPGFLFGLLAVSIPVIIHLFNFRRYKKLYFTNVSFIKELKLQTQKQSKLKHLLVLLMRILAIAAIVMAFAQPFIPYSDKPIQHFGQNAVSIYLDNSFSEESESGKGTVLDAAKEKTKEIVSVYKSSDIFQLLTNDFEARHQRFVSRDEFLSMVDEVKLSPVVKTIPEVMSRQSDLFSKQAAKIRTAYEISDFQKGVMNGDFRTPDTTVNTYFVLLKSLNQNNLYIDSCWFEAPVQQAGQSVKLKVKITNSSGDSFEKIPVRLKVNGQQKALASVDLKPNADAEVTLPYTNYETGIQYGEVEITDYPVTFDDNFFFTYNVASLTTILSINGKDENKWLDALFKNDSSFLFRNVKENNIDYSSLSSYQMIILNELGSISTGLGQEIQQFVKNGGTLVVLPSDNIDFNSYRVFLNELKSGFYTEADTSDTRISEVNFEHPLFSDVFDKIPENIDLPVVFKSYTIQVETKSRLDVLMRMQNGRIFLCQQPFGSGRVFLFAVPFETSFSNFPKHAIFVPTLYKMAISSLTEDPLYYTIGKNNVIGVNNADIGSDDVFHIKSLNSDFEFIPEHRKVNIHCDIYPHGQIVQAGNYTLSVGDKPLKGLAFNYDRSESVMQFFTADELRNFIIDHKLKNTQVIDTPDKPFVQTLTEMSQGTRLWKWFVMLALLFLLGESLLLRFWK